MIRCESGSRATVRHFATSNERQIGGPVASLYIKGMSQRWLDTYPAGGTCLLVPVSKSPSEIVPQ